VNRPPNPPDSVPTEECCVGFHAYRENVPSLDEYNQRLKQAMEQELDKFVQERVPDDIDAKEIVGMGSVYRQILDVASRIKADLIVMSGYRPSLQSFLLGTNAERVARHAECSVYIVRP